MIADFTVPFLLQLLVAFAALVIGTLTDLKTREVPDYLSFFLLAAGFGMAVFFSILSWSFNPLLSSLLGFVVFFLLSLVLFYTGQWGGGDAKLFIGLGALLGVPLPSLSFSALLFSFPFLFLAASFFFGGLIGLGYLIVQFRRHANILIPRLRERFTAKSLVFLRWLLYFALTVLFAALFLVNDFFVKLALLLLMLCLLFLFYLPPIVRVVEEHCMICDVPLAKVTIGDWIAENIIVRGKRLAGPRDLGISPEQLLLLKKFKIRTVRVKYGLPFVPSFLLGFITAVVITLII